jgi:copper transport outer membrane protein MctB
VFDFRYHVVSLAAVFLALVLGILVGVAISDPQLADRIDKRALQDRVSRLEGDVADAQARLQEQRAAEAYVARTYDAVMHDRLAGKRIAVLVIGSGDRIRAHVAETIDAAGGTLVRVRSIRVPVPEGIEESVVPAQSSLSAVGRELGSEFVSGGETPVWDALGEQLVLEQEGALDEEVDAVVVARSAEPQPGDTARFLRGLYEGVEGAVPAVGVEETGTEPSLVPVLSKFDDFSSVNNVDSRVGRVTLAVLLAGGTVGHYGIDAPDGVMPTVEPVTAPPTS